MTKKACINAGRRSRDRLGLETIPLYQVHWPIFPMEGVLDALAELREEGIIDRVGVCNFCAGQLLEADRLARERSFTIVSNQIRLNASDRGALDFLVPVCRRLGVAVIAYSPLGQGALGKTASEALRWVGSQPIACAIPGTNRLENLKENLRSLS